jgi:hypothetical protein
MRTRLARLASVTVVAACAAQQPVSAVRLRPVADSIVLEKRSASAHAPRTDCAFRAWSDPLLVAQPRRFRPHGR